MTLPSLEQVMTFKNLMYGFGFLGEAVFGLRFYVQWIASERKKKVVMPVAFWYMSLVGAVILFLYAMYQRDPVFSVGMGGAIPVYLRNLYFHYRTRKAERGDVEG